MRRPGIFTISPRCPGPTMRPTALLLALTLLAGALAGCTQVQAGQLDMAISAMTIRPDRAEVVDLSIPYSVAEAQAVTKRADDARRFTQVSDIAAAGIRIGVQSGTTAQFMDEPPQQPAVAEDASIVIAFTFPVEEEYGVIVQKGNDILDSINDALRRA